MHALEGAGRDSRAPETSRVESFPEKDKFKQATPRVWGQDTTLAAHLLKGTQLSALGPAPGCLISPLVWQKPSRPAGPEPPQPRDPCIPAATTFLPSPLSHLPCLSIIPLSSGCTSPHWPQVYFQAFWPHSFTQACSVPS